MLTRNVCGVTLIELMATVSVISILATLAVPDFIDLYHKIRMRNAVNDQMAWLREGRALAVMDRREILICPQSQNLSNECGKDWNAPQLMFFDKNKNRILETEKGDELIAIKPGLDFEIKLEWRGAPPVQYIKNKPVFSAQAYNGTFRFCDLRRPEFNRAIIINRQGRARFSQDSDDNQIHELPRRDETEEPIECKSLAVN